MHDRHVFMQNAFLVAQHFGSSRGLLGKMFDFILVLKLFLKAPALGWGFCFFYNTDAVSSYCSAGG